MASIRRLKKDIKNLASDLMLECKTYIRFHPGADEKKTIKIIGDIESKSNALINEINHYSEKGDVSARDFYKKIITRVKKELIPLLDKIGDIEKNTDPQNKS
jgi:hypothetical protein